MAFGGLWDGFKWPDGTVLRKFTAITTNAKATVVEQHDRMPVIIEPHHLPTWLGRWESILRRCCDRLAMMG